jgi:sulfoxide reductase heme-binding subunit YedZ
MRKFFRILVFLLCCVPFALLLFDLGFGRLSANPIADITDRTGLWTLRMLLLTLTVTPLRRLTGWPALAPYRRTLGLFAFFYAALHFLTYFVLDQFFAFRQILNDIAKRPFITVGLASFLLLTPLAVTSIRRIARRLGGRRWKRLHRLVYVAAVGGVVHYLWVVKADISRPLAYGAVLAALLGLRVWFFLRDRMRRATAASGSGGNASLSSAP